MSCYLNSKRRTRSDIVDHIRHRNHTPRFPHRPAHTASHIPQTLFNWLQANPYTTLCLSCYSGCPDDRVEGCLTYDPHRIRKRPIQPCRYARVPQSPPRRSYRRSQDHLDSMWPPSNELSRNLANSASTDIWDDHSLTHRNRKNSSAREQGSC